MRAVNVEAFIPCSAAETQYVVDRGHVPGIGLASPAEKELLGRRLAGVDDRVGDALVGPSRRLGDDRDHRRREPGQVVARLLVRDVDQLAELPLRRKVGRRALEVGHRPAGGPVEPERIGVRHARKEAVVDQEAPDLLVRLRADELLDVHAAIAKGTPFAIGFGDLRLERDDAFEPRLELVHRAEST